MTYQKTYVDVNIDVKADGRIFPRAVSWPDGRTYEIELLKQTCRAASEKVAGFGIRYTVIIRSREAYLFYDNGRWFMEAKYRA